MTTVSAILRTTQAHCLHLCRKETLQHGICYYSADFPDLPEANQFREVLLEEQRALPQALEEAESWFASHGLSCRRWSAAIGQPVEAMAEVLAQAGYCRKRLIALTLGGWKAAETAPAVRVLPARAMRAAHRRVIESLAEAEGFPHVDQFRRSYERRLDDPSYDAFVALVEGQPAGQCALYQVGDVGRIMSLMVVESMREQGVAESLLATALALAKRLTLPMVCAAVDAGDEFTLNQLAQAGLVEDGELFEFDRVGEATT